jgi:hypothetical protein
MLDIDKDEDITAEDPVVQCADNWINDTIGTE